MNPVYIISTACMSPQSTFDNVNLDFEAHYYNGNLLQCIEPDFSKYINPVQIRRMSRGLKIGYTTAIECLNQMEPIQIDAIIIGTGKGCMSDTEKFLHSIIEYNETALNATYFIHSTYNQLNGMIALNKKINSYNVTYVHRGFSFEHSLMDAMLLFTEGEAQNALVGSFEEITQEHFTIKKHWGYWKSEDIYSKDLLKSPTRGTIAGEGSSFYVLSKNKPNQPCVAIQHISTLYNPTVEILKQEIEHLLNKYQLNYKDIDILLLGANGDFENDENYVSIRNLMPNTQDLYFKHLCGEYDTAIILDVGLPIKC